MCPALAKHHPIHSFVHSSNILLCAYSVPSRAPCPLVHPELLWRAENFRVSGRGSSSSRAPRQRDVPLPLLELRVPPEAPGAPAELLLHFPARGGAAAPGARPAPEHCSARIGAAGRTTVVRSLKPPSPSSSALPAGGRCRKCRHFGVFCSGGSGGGGGGTRRLPRDSASAVRRRRRRRLRRSRQQLRQRRAQVQPLVSAAAAG